MIYPAVIVLFALGIVSGIMVFVIPKLQTIFNDFGITLPPMTKVLLGASAWFMHGTPPGWTVILFGPVVAIMLFKLIRSSSGGRGSGIYGGICSGTRSRACSCRRA